jgi:hypothetical protein
MGIGDLDDAQFVESIDQLRRRFGAGGSGFGDPFAIKVEVRHLFAGQRLGLEPIGLELFLLHREEASRPKIRRLGKKLVERDDLRRHVGRPQTDAPQLRRVRRIETGGIELVPGGGVRDPNPRSFDELENDRVIELRTFADLGVFGFRRRYAFTKRGRLEQGRAPLLGPSFRWGCGTGATSNEQDIAGGKDC